MSKPHFSKDFKKFWENVNKADEEYRLKQARLPFIKKLAILEELRERTRLLRNAKEISKED